MEEHFKRVTQYLSTAVEVVAVVIIVGAVAQATVSLLRWLFRRDRPGQEELQHARLHLGQWLVLSLEFLLAADILRTAVSPTWDELGKLATIIVLRTILNYFLQGDVESAAGREPGGRPPERRPPERRPPERRPPERRPPERPPPERPPP